MSDAPWTYSGDPTTSQLDEVRFLVQDTDPELKLLSNPEISYLLGFWMPIYCSTYFVAHIAARRISAKFTGVVTVNADGVAVNVSDLSERYDTLAARLRAEYVESSVGGEIDLSGLMMGATNEPGVLPLSFAKGLFDNPEAGQQDYGGELFYPVLEWCR